MNCNWRMVLVAVALLFGSAAKTQAGFIPVGVQNDVALATVTGAWGWTQLYRGNYSVDTVSLAPILLGADQYLMLGAVNNSTGVVHVLAAALTTDVTTHTSQNVTHAANGSEWYYNGGSMGFAALGDTISQNEADINGTNAAQRLSWHTDSGTSIGEYGTSPLNIRFGYRAGEFEGLNGSNDWDKIILTANAGAAVPEPSTFALFGFGAIGLTFCAYRRRRASAV